MKNSSISVPYLGAIFLGASLLFLVQPMMAKTVLPLLGGSPGVWNLCMVFYQALLLTGYLYAHFLTRLRDRRRQVLVHVAVIAVAAMLLPIGLPTGARPPVDASPTLWLLGVLLLSVGGPFFVLSSTSPLLQRWFSETTHDSASDPYFLYVASNAGSMLALLAYPTLVEPMLALGLQRATWAWSFGGFALGVLVCGLLMLRHPRQAPARAQPSLEPEPGSEPIGRWRRFRWVLLALAPSSLMLGVTQHLVTDIAAVPLLWVVPLAIYLLTFIVVFSRLGPPVTAAANIALPFVAVVVAALLIMGLHRPILPQVIAHLALLLVAGLACHGRLAGDRPAAANLTEFYLLMSLGGVLGGAFNSLLAPVLFDSIAEYPLAILLACLLRPARWAAGAPSPRWRIPRLERTLVPALVLMTFIAAPAILSWLEPSGKWLGIPLRPLLRAGLPGVACLVMARRPLSFGLSLSVLLFAPWLGIFSTTTELHAERTFFGVHQVLREKSGSGHWNYLSNGTILHGVQYSQEPWASTPTSYYTKGGPLGDVMRVLEDAAGPKHLGLVGLGAATIASYGRPEWRLAYFEIDPEVVRIANDPALFSYLAGSKSPIELVLGDARLTLQSRPEGEFDLLLLDAFSSDAIPVHLLTREAIEIYFRKLKPNGLLLFHVSNWHLNLAPVLGATAAELGLPAVVRADNERTRDERVQQKKEFSTWVVLARHKRALRGIAREPGWRWLGPTPGFRPWTDDYSSLSSVVNWGAGSG